MNDSRVALIQFGYDFTNQRFCWPDERLSGWAINYGDVLVCESLVKLFSVENPLYVSFGEVCSECTDLAIVRGSTYLHNHFDFDAANTTLDSVNAPILMVGLGAQNPELDPTFMSSNKAARDFVARLSEKSNSISVRGEFTAKVLECLGAKNIRVTGCPSMFINFTKPRINLTDYFACNKNSHIALTIHSELWDDHFCYSASDVFMSHGNLYRYLLDSYPNFRIFEQGNINELIISDRKELLSKRRNLAAVMMEKFSLNLEKDCDLDDFISRFVRISDTYNWLSKISDFDAVIGYRFHGVLAGACQGIPSYLYSYDSRLEEFCQLYNMPFSKVRDGKFIDPILQINNHDWGLFNNSIEKCYLEFCKFYSENGVGHRVPFFCLNDSQVDEGGLGDGLINIIC